MQVVETKRVFLVYAGKALREGSGSDFYDSTIRKTVEKQKLDSEDPNNLVRAKSRINTRRNNFD